MRSDERWKILFSFFFNIKLWKWTLVHFSVKYNEFYHWVRSTWSVTHETNDLDNVTSKRSEIVINIAFNKMWAISLEFWMFVGFYSPVLLFYMFQILRHRTAICEVDEVPCGLTGFCIEESGECDGFHDCHINTLDEDICGKKCKWNTVVIHITTCAEIIANYS